VVEVVSEVDDGTTVPVDRVTPAAWVGFEEQPAARAAMTTVTPNHVTP
jgi:hypothetical protein